MSWSPEQVRERWARVTKNCCPECGAAVKPKNRHAPQKVTCECGHVWSTIPQA